MEFNPEYAQPGGGNLSSSEHRLHRLTMMGSAADAADAHADVALKHQSAIQSYSWHSTALNHHMISPGKSARRNHPSAIAKLEALHKSLSTAVEEAPGAHADMHLYGGISTTHADRLIAEGDTASLKAWGSFSHNPEVAGKFAGTVNGSSTGRERGAVRTILHLHVRQGQRGLLHCEAASLHPNEKETLVRPGTKLRINKIYEPTDPSGRRIISAEIIE
jgi:hypothetical protein